MRTHKSARTDQKTTRPAGRTPTAERQPRATHKEQRPRTLAQLALDLAPAAPPSHADAPSGVSRGSVMHAASTPQPDAPAKATRRTSDGPAKPSAMLRHFGELRAALADGWEIVQPIFARPLWSATDDSTTAFNFVLRGPHGTRLITVPKDSRVERFIRDRHLQVDHVR